MGYPPETYLKLKSREMSFVQNICLSRPIVLKIYTGHDSDTAMLFAKFHNDCVILTDFMDERDFAATQVGPICSYCVRSSFKKWLLGSKEFSSLASPKVVICTSFGAARDDILLKWLHFLFSVADMGVVGLFFFLQFGFILDRDVSISNSIHQWWQNISYISNQQFAMPWLMSLCCMILQTFTSCKTSCKNVLFYNNPAWSYC